MDEITPYPRTDPDADDPTSRAPQEGAGPSAGRTPGPDLPVPDPDPPDPEAAPGPAAPPGSVGLPDPAAPPDPADLPTPQRPTLRLDRPAEVLAWLPYQVKFWPQESVVLVSLRRAPGAESGAGAGSDAAARPRSDTAVRLEPGLIARTDLSVIGSGSHGREAQVDMGRHLHRDGAHRALCAIYTEQSFASVLRGQGPAGRTLGWWRSTPWGELGKTYLIGPERFRCVDCADAPCCPHTGQPLGVLDNTEAAAWHVFHGHRYARDREELVTESAAPAAQRRAVGTAARQHAERRPDLPGAARSAWHREMERRWVTLVQACLATHRPSHRTGGHPAAGTRADEPSTDDLGAVLAGLTDPWVRDAALLWSGTGQLLGDAVRDNVVDAVFSGRLLPQLRLLNGADRALTLLDAHATDQWKPPVLASRAWLAWWSGDGARANILIERALAIDPEYSLAQLLGTALVHGIPPGWARRPGVAS